MLNSAEKFFKKTGKKVPKHVKNGKQKKIAKK